jgi:hypothetical protein
MPKRGPGEPVNSTVKPSTVPSNENEKLFLVSDKFFRKQLELSPIGAIGPLSAEEVHVLMATLGQRESTFRTDIFTEFGFAGKYQFGPARLKDLGYIKTSVPVPSTAKGNEAIYVSIMENDNSWSGKNGIVSLQDFRNSPAKQEQIMFESLKKVYSDFSSQMQGRSPADVAGLLTAGHLGGGGGVLAILANESGAKDQLGTSVRTYYNLGKAAIEVSAKKYFDVDAGILLSGDGV